jgi:hypothetical protein
MRNDSLISQLHEENLRVNVEDLEMRNTFNFSLEELRPCWDNFIEMRLKYWVLFTNRSDEFSLSGVFHLRGVCEAFNGSFKHLLIIMEPEDEIPDERESSKPKESPKPKEELKPKSDPLTDMIIRPFCSEY